MSVYIDRDKLENFAMNCVGGVVTMKQIHDFPAIHVPPHGRLIDADALEQESQKRLLMCNKNDNQDQKPYEIMRAIALAPTVIPEEESET